MSRPFLVSQYYRRRTQCGLGFRLTDNYKLYINVLFDTYITQVIEVCHKKKLHYLVCIFNYAMGFAVHTYKFITFLLTSFPSTFVILSKWQTIRSREMESELSDSVY